MIVLRQDYVNWEFAEVEKWWGFGCGKNLGNTQMASTARRHVGWPPGAHAVVKILQVKVLCTEDGFCSIGLESTGESFSDVWEG